MAYKVMQIRRDTAANWTSNNPTLSAGEFGLETDTGRMKIGDGSTAWTSLLYIVDINGLTADATPVGSTDYVMTWDSSASAFKKVLLDNLPGGSSSGDEIIDADSDTYVNVEPTSDADTIVGYNAGVQTLEITPVGIVNLPKHSTVRVYKDSDQSFAVNTWTKVTFTDVDWDIQSEWDGTNHRFTATEDGVYDISGVMTCYNWTSFSAGGLVFAAVRVNGATPAEVAPVAQILTYDTQYQMQFAATVYLTTNDYIDIWVAANLAGYIRGADSRLTWISVNKLT